MIEKSEARTVRTKQRRHKPFYFDPDRSIVLGDFLDILLNRTGSANRRNLPAFEEINYSEKPAKKLTSCSDEYAAKKNLQQYDGGILLPYFQRQGQSSRQVDGEGSGNIVIMGAAGTGKSTLAFQIAAACASEMNHGIAVYYSLEVSIQQFIYSMASEKTPGSESRIQIKELRDFSKQLTLDSDESLGNALEEIFLSSDTIKEDSANTKIKPQILLPSLSPCSISDDQASHTEVFLKRFKELELLLRAISYYNNVIVTRSLDGKNIDPDAMKKKPDELPKKQGETKAQQAAAKIPYADTVPRVKVVVIDSINAFSNSTLNRQEIIRLMSLFKEYGIIGIFTLGDDGDQSSEAMIEASTIQYLADVVISLTCAYTNSYTHNYLEITKSRYRQQVLGKHPYKINAISAATQNLASAFMPGIKKKLEVLPSLHYRTNASAMFKMAEEIESETDEWTLFGIEEMKAILPEHFLHRSKSLTQIITIIGDSGLYKSDLAIHALLNGIYEGESGLIVRLSDRELFRYSGVRLSTELHKRITDRLYLKHETEITMTEESSDRNTSKFKQYKFDLHGWTPNFTGKNTENGKEAGLFEVSFKSGVLYPEEMVDELLRIIKQKKIKRIVLADLKLIGVSYPFLVDSPTSGKIFLSAFLHIMRNYGVHVIITSSLSAQADSVDQINRARILSDAVLDIKQESKRTNVTIFGEGLITKKQKKYNILTHKTKTKFRFLDRPDTNSDGKGHESYSPELETFYIKPGSQQTKEENDKQNSQTETASKTPKNT